MGADGRYRSGACEGEGTISRFNPCLCHGVKEGVRGWLRMPLHVGYGNFALMVGTDNRGRYLPALATLQAGVEFIVSLLIKVRKLVTSMHATAIMKMS